MANGAAFKLEDFLPYRLSVAANRVSRVFARRYSEAYGLSIPEWRVLAVVGRFGTVSPSTVGEWTTMDKVKVSRAAATLVARGLLRQTQDPADGRARVLRMTRKGQRVFESVVPIARRLEEELTEGLSRAEWTSFQRTLAKLHAHVERLTGAEDEAEPD